VPAGSKPLLVGKHSCSVVLEGGTRYDNLDCTVPANAAGKNLHQVFVTVPQ
jgi:hypothetical protein